MAIRRPVRLWLSRGSLDPEGAVSAGNEMQGGESVRRSGMLSESNFGVAPFVVPVR